MPWYLEIKKIKFKDPITTIKVLIVIHYMLSVLGAIGTFNPFVYLFYNFVIIGLLIWSLYSKSEEPLKLAIILNMCAIILDALYFVALADNLGSHRVALSGAASILHLIFRPISILLLIKKDEKLSAVNNEDKNDRLHEINDNLPPNTIA